MNYELTVPVKMDFGQSFVESPLLWAGTWLINVCIPYLPEPLAEHAEVMFKNSADEQVGPIWNLSLLPRPTYGRVTLKVDAFITLFTETKLKVLVDGLAVPEATITYLRLRP